MTYCNSFDYFEHGFDVSDMTVLYHVPLLSLQSFLSAWNPRSDHLPSLGSASCRGVF
jgi:hypothetical protein